EIDALVEAITPHYAHGKMHDIAKNLGGWLCQRGWSEADAVEVASRLPSVNPQNAIEAVRAAFGIAQPFGWTELNALVGEAPMAALDGSTPNPKAEREAQLNAITLEAMQAAAAPLAPLAPVPPPEGQRSTILTRLRALSTQGPPIALGIPPLDRSTRGGLRPQKTMILGGAPGAGKTSFMRQIADNVAKSGIPVGWFAADEESVGIDVRRVQAI